LDSIEELNVLDVASLKRMGQMILRICEINDCSSEGHMHEFCIL